MSKRVFPGGIPFAELLPSKISPEPLALAPPDEVSLALEDQAGAAVVLVKKGDIVEPGRRLNEGSRAAHASIGGVVADVRSFAMHRTGKETVVVVRKNDEHPSETEATASAVEASPETDLHASLVTAGVLPPAENGAGPDTYQTVVLVGFGQEPTIVHDSLLLRSRAEEAISGLKVIAGALGAKELVIALTEDQTDLQQSLSATAGESVKVLTFPAVYPIGLPRVLRHALAGETSDPNGKVFFVPVTLALAASDVVRHGKPFTSTFITVGRVDTGETRYAEVPLGTKVGDIVKAMGVEPENVQGIVDGGLLTGLAIGSLDQPVTKRTAAIFFRAGGTDLYYEPDPCIRCGKCVRNCPAGLMPTHLERVAKRGQIEEEREAFLACLDCGVCAYGCPSHRELVQWIQMARNTLLSSASGEEA